MSEILTPEQELEVLRVKMELLPKPDGFEIHSNTSGWWAARYVSSVRSSEYVIRKGERGDIDKSWGVYYNTEIDLLRACVALLSGDTDKYEWLP